MFCFEEITRRRVALRPWQTLPEKEDKKGEENKTKCFLYTSNQSFPEKNDVALAYFCLDNLGQGRILCRGTQEKMKRREKRNDDDDGNCCGYRKEKRKWIKQVNGLESKEILCLASVEASSFLDSPPAVFSEKLRWFSVIFFEK